MKYIRTKDGKIRIVVDPNEFDEEEKRKIPDNCTMVKANNIYGCAIVGNENIIKQSDNLEELCDEWVLPPQRNKPTYDTLNAKLFDFKSLKNYWAKEQKIIYGAIWTEKGLIYIAKLNEKGELELLWNTSERKME